MDPFARTKLALRKMENVFRCDLCFETCLHLYKVAKCPDYFCRSCAEDNECFCPICKIPAKASEVRVDRLSAVLSDEFKKLRRLICRAEGNKKLNDEENRPIIQQSQQPGLKTKDSSAFESSLSDFRKIEPTKDSASDSNTQLQESKSTLYIGRKLANTKTFATAENRSFIRKSLRRIFEKSESSILTTPVSEERTSTKRKTYAAVRRSYIRNITRKKFHRTKPESTVSIEFSGPPASQCAIEDTTGASHESQTVSSTTSMEQKNVYQPRKRGRKSLKEKNRINGFSSPNSNTGNSDSLPSVNISSNVRVKDKLGNSALQLACLSKSERSVFDDVKRYLFEDGVNPNERDNNNWTPLHEAAARGHTKIVGLLLKRGAIVDAVGGDDLITPLHDAVINGHLETARILLSYGASTIQHNGRGATAFDMTKDEGFLSLLHHYRNNPVVQETPVFNIHNRRELCLCFTSGARDAYSASVVKLATLNLANINFKNEVCEKVTHLIVTSRTCRRTLKFFAALALGKWIVTGDWLLECYKKRQLVPESAFEVVGTNLDPLSGGPRLSRENSLWLLPPLFANIHVYCRDLNQECIDELKKVLQYAGAKIVSREPRSDADLLPEYNTVLFHTDPYSPESKVNFLIIYDSDREDQVRKNVQENGSERRYSALKHLNTRRIKTVPIFWIFSCLQSFKILPFPFAHDDDSLSDNLDENDSSSIMS